MRIILPLLLVAIVVLLLAYQQAFAHPLFGEVTRQRIGNYDFEIATDPNTLQAGEPATIMMSLTAVNGDHLVDVPIELMLEKDGQIIQLVGPLVVPFGHYNYTYTFPEPGNYVLYAGVQDYAYSGERLTFTFFLIVPGAFDYLGPGLGAGVAGAAIAGTLLFLIIRRRR